MSEFKKCIDVIKSGGIILYPTDTIYGLGCDALNMNATKRINIIKGIEVAWDKAMQDPYPSEQDMLDRVYKNE